MNRRIVSLLSYAVGFVLVCGAVDFVLISVAKTPTLQADEAAGAPFAVEPALVAVDELSGAADLSERADLDPDLPFGRGAAPRADLKTPTLRERFIELSRTRAERMSAEDLARAVDEIAKAIADEDQAADHELARAIEQLKSVVENFPGTPAARLANGALAVLEPKRAPPDLRGLRNSDEDAFDRDPAPARTVIQPRR